MSNRSTIQLTRRQQEVLVLTSLGHTASAIASELGIGTWTVKGHHRAIRQRLRARSNAEAVAFAFQCGLLR